MFCKTFLRNKVIFTLFLSQNISNVLQSNAIAVYLSLNNWVKCGPTFMHVFKVLKFLYVNKHMKNKFVIKTYLVS